MKTVHWTMLNGSGLANMATDICDAEVRLGNDSIVCNTTDMSTWEKGMDGDIHVIHSHIPDKLSFSEKTKVVNVEHGAPEHVFEVSLHAGLTGSYGPSDPLALTIYLIKRADAVVTFWPRQAYIWKLMTRVPVHLIPMGVDTKFWTPVPKRKLLTGSPALLTAENCHSCKWPIDLMLTWQYVVNESINARAHFLNIPYDQHRWWLPLSYAVGTQYTSFLSPNKLDRVQLREFICAADYYYSPVTYGDFNRISLEAAACGAKIISYAGNEYSHYWLTQTDQRVQVAELLKIFSGETKPREAKKVPDISETAEAMLKIYEEVLRK